ncbi:MAG: alpha/beta hydrolase [Luteibacter sp.]
MGTTWRHIGMIAALAAASASALAGEAPAASQPPVWPPAAPFHEMLLWPEGRAIAKPPVTGPENTRVSDGRVNGELVTIVENVTRPTMTIYPPKGTNTGATIVVAPGGGYRILAIDLEGTEVCDWATTRGITCAVLKYRVPTSGPQWDGSCNCRREPKVHMALQDAQRAISLLRAQAKTLQIDPDKIGILGFSAGGHVVVEVSNAAKRTYTPVDAADKEDFRANYAIALYPGHIWEAVGLKMNPTIHVTARTPPTFIVMAEDDHVDFVQQALTYYIALQKADVPTEMHLYAQGGHAFGLRRNGLPITEWPDLAEKWMHTIGVLQKAN